jgi:GxxExxY protein
MSRQDAKSAKDEPDLDVDTLAHLVIGAAIEVYRQLGPGYLEGVYEEAIALEFDFQGIPYQRQHAGAVNYKGQQVGKGKIDFLVGGKLVVELKAVEKTAACPQGASHLLSESVRLSTWIAYKLRRPHIARRRAACRSHRLDFLALLASWRRKGSG